MLLCLAVLYGLFPVYYVTVQSLKTPEEDVFGSPRDLAATNLAAMDLERERYPEALAAFSGFLQAFDALPASDRGRVAEVTLCLRLARALLGVGRTDEADALLRRSGQLTPAFYEHAPLRLQEHLVKARLLGARGEVNNARAEVALARASLRAQPALGPHFERQVQLTERDITRGR